MIASDGVLHVVRVVGGVIRLRDGVLDDRAREVFTSGQCHALSVAVHEATGWPVEVVLSRRRRDRSDWSSGLDCPRSRMRVLASRWVHSVVRTPSGGLLDVSGVSEEAALLARWCSVSSGLLVPVVPSELLALADRGSGVPADLVTARSFAPLVLAEYAVKAG